MELLVVVTIIALLSALAWNHMGQALLRAQVVGAQEHLRLSAHALDVYRLDHGFYPSGRSSGQDDPLGILAGTALVELTTPIAYVSPTAFQDQFGPTQQPDGDRDPFGPRRPQINPEQYLLYFYYPKLSELRRDPRLNVDGFAVASIGPDKVDSYVAYYPFPQSLPPQARMQGIFTVQDTVYDPSNGLRSSGDLARFGGEAQHRGSAVGGGG